MRVLWNRLLFLLFLSCVECNNLSFTNERIAFFSVLYKYEHIKKYSIIIIYDTNIYTAFPLSF